MSETNDHKEISVLTQSLLKSNLNYNPESGIFTRIKPSQGVRVGDIAGSVSSEGYLQIQISGKKYAAHRLAFLYMTGCFPPDQVDHANHNKQDNRWINLDLSTNKKNGKNQKLQSRNTSGECGVFLEKHSGKWCAEICVDGKNVRIGRFIEFNDAVVARRKASQEHSFHGNHGR